MASPLINAATEWQRLYAELVEMFGDDDQQALLDTASGMSDLPAMIELTLSSREDDLVLVTGLGARIEEMRDRLERYKARAQAKKELVEAAMIRADIRKLEFAEFTVSLGKRQPHVIVTDESIIPPEFFATPAPVPSKTAVKRAIEDGKAVPGATLSNGGVGMTIRKR